MNYRNQIIALTVLILTWISGFGQVAVKTNLLYDAMTTPNLGAEIGVGDKSTLNLVYGINPWHFNSDTHGVRQAKHWVVMPEYRWWFCSRLNGSFIGVHLLGGEMNVANVDLPIPGYFFKGTNLQKAVKDNRYQGPFAGVGFTYGYQWPLSRHWNLEAELGVGYAHVWYDEYPCTKCGKKKGSGHANYIGATKLALSLLYVF